VDYSKQDVIDAYLLGYFPHYIATALNALRLIPSLRKHDYLRRRFKAVFIGGGPLPEVVALAEALIDCAGPEHHVDVVLVDVHAATWSAVVSDTLALARAINPRFRPHLTTIVQDMRQLLNEQTRRAVEDSDLVMFQSCLNEVVQGADFDANCTYLAESLGEGGHVVVCDLHEYDEVQYSVQKMRVLLSKVLTLLHDFEPHGDPASPFDMPPWPLFYYFYGAEKIVCSAGEYPYIFPKDCIPRKWLGSSVAVWKK
jgi:hypothetical protein